MTALLDDGHFFFPGPTEVRAEVLGAMLRPMIPHRSEAFERLFDRVQQGLRPIFRTSRPVFISSSSATGLMEAAIRCAPPGRVLALVNGAFSERFARVAQACGREVDALDVEWGGVVAPEQVEGRLRGGSHRIVTLVHSETSTGSITDVAGVQEVARRHSALCLVDSVSGIGGIRVETDLWGLDYVFTGSQKALALPPGLALAVASEAYLRGAREATGKGLYFDLAAFESAARRSQTPNTPALPLLYALEAQVNAFAAEGIERRWERHEAMRRQVEEWVSARSERGVRLLAPAGARAATVSSIVLPPRLTALEVVAGLEGRGYVVGAGYGKLRDQVIRIGHMGDHTVSGLARCLDALDKVIGRR